MASLLQDQGVLVVGLNIDVSTLCIGYNVDYRDLSISERVDSQILCTSIGDVTAQQRYRADTTLLTTDNTSITADYSL